MEPAPDPRDSDESSDVDCSLPPVDRQAESVLSARMAIEYRLCYPTGGNKVCTEMRGARPWNAKTDGVSGEWSLPALGGRLPARLLWLGTKNRVEQARCLLVASARIHVDTHLLGEEPVRARPIGRG